MSLLLRSILCAIFVTIFQNEKCVGVLLWGCEYVNTQIFYRNNTNLFGDIQEGAKIDYDDLTQIHRNVNQIMSDVASERPYNRIDNMRRFRNQILEKLSIVFVSYEDVTYEFFRNFFMEYNPNFVEDSAINGLVVEVLRRFVKRYPEYSENVYLASVCELASEHYTNYHISEEDIDDSFIHGHLAAIFKFNINNVNGYMVMDPERGILNALPIMETDIEFKAEHVRVPSAFRMLPCSKVDQNNRPIPPYIIQGQRREEDMEPTNHLYYVKRSFCAMMQVTYKRDLLISYRTLYKLDGQGNMLASITADMLQNVNANETKFTVETENGIFHFYCTEYSSPRTRQEIERILSKAGADFMGYPDRKIFRRKLGFFIAVMRDHIFLRLYRQLVNEIFWALD